MVMITSMERSSFDKVSREWRQQSREVMDI